MSKKIQFGICIAVLSILLIFAIGRFVYTPSEKDSKPDQKPTTSETYELPPEQPAQKPLAVEPANAGNDYKTPELEYQLAELSNVSDDLADDYDRHRLVFILKFLTPGWDLLSLDITDKETGADLADNVYLEFEQGGSEVTEYSGIFAPDLTPVGQDDPESDEYSHIFTYIIDSYDKINLNDLELTAAIATYDEQKQITLSPNANANDIDLTQPFIMPSTPVQLGKDYYLTPYCTGTGHSETRAFRLLDFIKLTGDRADFTSAQAYINECSFTLLHGEPGPNYGDKLELPEGSESFVTLSDNGRLEYGVQCNDEISPEMANAVDRCLLLVEHEGNSFVLDVAAILLPMVGTD